MFFLVIYIYILSCFDKLIGFVMIIFHFICINIFYKIVLTLMDLNKLNVPISSTYQISFEICSEFFPPQNSNISKI